MHRRYLIKNQQLPFSEPQVIAVGGGNNLFGLRTNEFVLDIYYENQGRLLHLYKEMNKNEQFLYQNPNMENHKIKPNSPIRVTRVGDRMDIFCISADNKICHFQWNQNTNRIHKFIKYLPGVGPDTNELSVTRNGNNIDIYFTRANRVFHIYFGQKNGWVYGNPEPISNADFDYGLSAVITKQSAIDVYYMSIDGKLRHLSTGDSINNGWQGYKYVQQSTVLHKTPRKIKSYEFDQLKKYYDGRHREGYNGKTYSLRIQGIEYLAKQFKTPKVEGIRQQINFMETIYPGMIYCEVTDKKDLIGFVMKKFDGQPLNEFLQDMKPDLLAKTIIIIELANKVAKLQYYKICHTDLHVQNIIWDKNNSAAWIIDFGNAFSFENMKCIRSQLTRIPYLRPPQVLRGPYSPIGVNAFQFAQIAIYILSGVSIKEFSQSGDLKELIKKIQKDKNAAQFLEPILKLRQVEQYRERVIDIELIQKLSLCAMRI